ncbi:uncharacterized protein isoform X2 [Rhodnius prolixus]
MGLPKTFVERFHEIESVRKMPYKQLGSTDLQISRLGFGGGSFSGFYGNFDDEKGVATVIEAVKKGINYIDTAPYYGEGRSEILLGKALKHIPREAYYISTKVGRYTTNWETMFDYSREKILSGFEQSLKRLGLTYVDFAVVHDVEFNTLDDILKNALPAVKELIAEGKVRYLAISGYPLSKLWEVISKSDIKIDIVLTYSRDTLIDASLYEYIPLFKSKGLGVIDAAPTAMRLLTNIGPPEWHPANQKIKELCAQAANYCKENGVELGRLAIYHTLLNSEVENCLVGFNTMEQLHSNLDTLLNKLSEKEEDVLKHIKQKYFTLKENLEWEGVEIELYKKHKK